MKSLSAVTMKKPYSGMRHRMSLARTEDSEKHVASIFKVKINREQ
jgi:hypothetical protein